MRPWFRFGRAVDLVVVEQVVVRNRALKPLIVRIICLIKDVVDDPVDQLGRQVGELGHAKSRSGCFFKTNTYAGQS
jgi:hypothetical protein